MDLLGFLVLLFWLGVIVSGFVTMRRNQLVIRRRVAARGGRAIEDVEMWSYVAWCTVKSLLWPVNLGLWLWLGRPEPGSYRQVAPTGDIAAPEPAPERPEPRPDSAPTWHKRPTPPAAPTRSADPMPSGRHARIVPAGSAPAFPTGPAAMPHVGPKAPHPTPGPKTGTVGSAYVPTPSAPPPPASTPSPVLPLPRAEFGAPQLDQDYALQVLARAGRPATPHNVFAAQERLGIMFSIKARQFIEGIGTERDWTTFVRRAGYPTRDMHAWPQHVLNALARWDPDVAPHIQDFQERYSSMLLESGGYLDSAPGEPLPTANDWHMNGIAQPSARPLAAPR